MAFLIQKVAKSTRQRRPFDSTHQTACSANTLHAGFRALVVNDQSDHPRRVADQRHGEEFGDQPVRERAGHRVSALLRPWVCDGGREGRRAADGAPGVDAYGGSPRVDDRPSGWRFWTIKVSRQKQRQPGLGSQLVTSSRSQRMRELPPLLVV